MIGREESSEEGILMRRPKGRSLFAFFVGRQLLCCSVAI